MRFWKALPALLGISFLHAQPAEDPQVVQARATLERTRGLVASGALPQADLKKAEDALADAQDSVTIRRDIYQQDLTEAQANELVAAAGRQFERRKQAFDKAKGLVESGLAPELSLDTFLRDLDFARKECDLAESRARLARELTEQAEAEAALATRPSVESPGVSPNLTGTERFDGSGIFNDAIFRKTDAAFQARFGRPLPVSAMGETAVHRALGFDHRGRVDVALNPDQPEGVWLRQYLTENRIPFFAFRHAVPGKATGAHIHLGPGSTRLAAGD
jgi:hypothetical protein